MDLMEIWAAVTGVLLSGMVALGAWHVRRTFELQARIMVLESGFQTLREDIKEIKDNIRDIHEHIVHNR